MIEYAFRPFDPRDAIELEGVVLHYPANGVTVTVDGKVAGYAGLWHIRGRDWAFLSLTDDMRRQTKTMIARNVREALAMYSRQGFKEIFTVCDLRYPRAREFMAWLGFVPLADHEKTPDIRHYEDMSAIAAGYPVMSWVRRA